LAKAHLPTVFLREPIVRKPEVTILSISKCFHQMVAVRNDSFVAVGRQAILHCMKNLMSFSGNQML
jgi:hypothetical protein